jgi:hypothetical protein
MHKKFLFITSILLPTVITFGSLAYAQPLPKNLALGMGMRRFLYVTRDYSQDSVWKNDTELEISANHYPNFGVDGRIVGYFDRSRMLTSFGWEAKNIISGGESYLDSKFIKKTLETLDSSWGVSHEYLSELSIPGNTFYIWRTHFKINFLMSFSDDNCFFISNPQNP